MSIRKVSDDRELSQA